MPDFRAYTKRHLGRVLDEIGRQVYTVVGSLDVRAWCTSEPVPFDERASGQERNLSVGDRWGGLFDCAWFHFTGTVPDGAAGHTVVLLLDVSGEMCVVDKRGTPLRGLTTAASGYDIGLGKPGKVVLPLFDPAVGGESIDVWADAGCNDLFGNLRNDGALVQASIAVQNTAARDLYYDYEVLLDWLQVLPEDSARYQQVLTALIDVMHLLVAGSVEGWGHAREVLAPLLARQGGDPSLRISAIGHAHIDLAWLWPIRETIRKGARTFATALAQMEDYPDYVFGASQPQLFLWMKEHYPALYTQIVEKVQGGRIEPQGAMWVEADTNVSGGEALVRQVLLGKRFFRDEFDVEVNYLWLPDVFGYSAALPQILKRAGVDYFLTQKISWSQINKFPHHSFWWQGIDGSCVLAHMFPEDTYNSPAAPRSLHKIEANYQDKGVSSHALMLFGIGDGGGGPGMEHLERLARIKNLAGLHPVQQEWVVKFLEKWSAEADRFARWVGELYLERHQGTLTTEAANKRYNRKLELALRSWEWAAAWSLFTQGTAYPSERLLDIWREVLLYQFHDILPGSSIKRVYDECLERYAALLEEVEAGIADNMTQLSEYVDTSGLDSPVVVFNPLSWQRSEWIEMDGRWIAVTVPSMGYCAVEAAAGSSVPAVVSASKEVLENDLLCVTFDADGSIASIYDKEADREVLAAGERGNRLAVHRDLGDAWDFAMDYAEAEPRYMELVSAEDCVDGPQAVLRQTYRLGHSELTQEIVLVAGSRRLEFRTSARWRETAAMLRTSFPVAVHAEEALFDIQYGHIRRPTHRNTTWDLARDEVAAHKWADLSQRDYGVALLNDCKYGHKVKDSVLDLDLLRSAFYPGPRLVPDSEVVPGEPHGGYTDQCDHIFTYALYPHLGDCVAGGVIQAGYELNTPLVTVPADESCGGRPRAASLIAVEPSNVIVEAVKKSEDGDDLIVRLYETTNSDARATVRFGVPVQAVSQVDLMEENPVPLELADNQVKVDLGPFEIATLRVTVSKPQSG